MTLAILEHVTRQFGELLALDDVSLDVHAGQLVGLLGPNGAGKTTMLSMLTGRRVPTRGTVRLFGADPRDPRSRQRLGSTPQESALPDGLRVGEVIDFVSRHFAARVPAAELAEEFGLTDLLRRQSGSLSGGQKRRVSVALAFAGRPDLVLLDEPTTGLDVDARHALWAALRRQHERGATVIVTSHYLEEIQALAERVVVLGAGRIVADDTLSAILGRVDVRQVELRTDRADALEHLPGVARVIGHDGDLVTVHASDADAFVIALVEHGIGFRDLAVRGATLEEAFLSLTESNPHTPEIIA